MCPRCGHIAHFECLESEDEEVLVEDECVVGCGCGCGFEVEPEDTALDGEVELVQEKGRAYDGISNWEGGGVTERRKGVRRGV